MTIALAALGAAIATLLYWSIATGAALRRRRMIGGLPLPLVILVATAAGAAAAYGVDAAAIAALAGVAVAALVDARTGSIFDPLTAALLVASLALAGVDGRLVDGVLGATATGGALLLLYALSGGRGLGLGDAKLGAALGMALGLTSGMTALALAFVFGGGYGAWLLATKRATAGSAIRFGPFVAAGTFSALLLPFGHRP